MDEADVEKVADVEEEEDMEKADEAEGTIIVNF